MEEKEKCRVMQGSMTAEAAFVIPVLFFAVYAFLQLFLFLQTQTEMQRTINELARELAGYGGILATVENLTTEGSDEAIYEEYGYDALVGSLSELAYLNYRMYRAVNKTEWESCIRGGALGITTSGSEVYDGNGTVRLVVSYHFTFPGNLFAFSAVPVVQSVLAKGFYGSEWDTVKKQSPEKQVYATPEGEVFHRYSTCSYLKVSVRQVAATRLGNERNESGEIYRQCSSCRKEPMGEIVYIAAYGNRYHVTLNCSDIKRDIRSMTEEMAIERGLRECSKCGKKKGE